MEVVGEALLFVSFEVLFNKLASSDLLKFARQEHVQAELKKWEKKLFNIREVLNDAEEKQITEQSVKAWLGDLRDLAYGGHLGRVLLRSFAKKDGTKDDGNHSPIRRNFSSKGRAWSREGGRDNQVCSGKANHNISVSIVAMGGMGKTTLARLVYDDAEATKHFNLKSWVCVSDQFDAMRITKTILESITSHASDLQDFSKIQERLRDEFKGKDSCWF
ncbi:putative disease resistance protein RGA3 [Vitis vinifera]|uniref:Putative disease resistance protein RGA3 n=1 Tax=Vitis vinifera TaxID=29760 RepID=A0A438GWL4_VITVI|nr:putative disease resistance protein RGA3 [Vitis vinifera]